MDSHPDDRPAPAPAEASSAVPRPLSARCDAFRAELNEYYLGRPVDEAALDAHADACPACGAFQRLAAELSCRDFVRFLDAYVDGELEPARRAVFERHLALCDDCVRYLESYRATIALGRAAFAASEWELEPQVPAELLAAIRRAGEAARAGPAA